MSQNTTTKSLEVDPFNTDHLAKNVKSKSIKGGLFVGLAQGFRFVFKLFSTYLLARLLTPEDFGLLGMATVVTGFATMFKDAGLSMATVQRKNVTHEQASTLFWINLGLSFVLMLVIIAISPVVAWFYDEPRLIGITIALAFTFIVGGLALQHQALLTRQMRFEIVSVISVVALAVSIATGVATAYYGAGYWALVFMTISHVAASTLMAWYWTGWIPSLPKKGTGVRSMVKFGGNLTAFSFVNFFVRNLDNLLVGYAFGPAALGLYVNAYRILLLPIRQINAPITTVAVPALSRVQQDPESFREYYMNGILLITALGMPIVALCFVMAEDAVLIVLGEKWMESAPIFRALAPASFLGTFNVAAGWIFIPLGQADRQLKIGTINAVAVISSFFIGLNWGPIGVATAFSICVVLMRVPTLLYTIRESPIKMSDIGRAILPGTVGSVVASIVLWQSIEHFELPANVFSRVSLGAGIFAIIYIVIFVSVLTAVGFKLPKINKVFNR